MVTDVVEIYEQTIKPMSTPDRFKLAQMILNDLPPQSIMDYSEEWSEEDVRDFAAHSFRHADRSLGEELEEETTWASQLAVMANDPEIRSELQAIEREFSATELDGLEQP